MNQRLTSMSRMMFWGLSIGALTPTLLSPAAFAALNTYVAETHTAVPRPGPITVGGQAWNCTARKCVTDASWPEPTVGHCRALMQKVGSITGFRNPKQQLTPAEIHACNLTVTAPRSPKRPSTEAPRDSRLMPDPVPADVLSTPLEARPGGVLSPRDPPSKTNTRNGARIIGEDGVLSPRDPASKTRVEPPPSP